MTDKTEKEELQIGWYDPGSKRFCYTDVKEASPDQHKGYTVPVYAGHRTPTEDEGEKAPSDNRLCILNDCSDCNGKQYPECDMARGWPTICPKSYGGIEILSGFASLQAELAEKDEELALVRKAGDEWKDGCDKNAKRIEELEKGRCPLDDYKKANDVFVTLTDDLRAELEATEAAFANLHKFVEKLMTFLCVLEEDKDVPPRHSTKAMALRWDWEAALADLDKDGEEKNA